MTSARSRSLVFDDMIGRKYDRTQDGQGKIGNRDKKEK
jgi:hypothetical protein